MNKLFIDTSQSFIIIGLMTETETFSKIESHGAQVGKFLASCVKELFEKAELSFKDLDEVIVGIGPGSYTGTRIGVAFAESLAFGLSLPCKKIPSLIFYLKKDQTKLGLLSNFGHTALIDIRDNIIFYTLLEEKLESIPLLNPKELVPSDDFQWISRLKTGANFSSLLYFNLK
jgi:tRNA threonylcarbamoyladenosine biosynthesis protein TsaB